jgi:hypothetical protein
LKRFLYSLDDLIVQLAKIVKISEKIRIFAAGYAKHIICLHCHCEEGRCPDVAICLIETFHNHGRNHTRNRIIM